jgi:hypothetical protein
MRIPVRPSHWLLGLAALACLGACRPSDAPKEPTDPNDDPQVQAAPDPHTGGQPIALARRSLALALN